MHKRKEIRKFVSELLATAVDVGTRIYPHRPDPVFQVELPAVLIDFGIEVTDHEETAPRIYNRKMPLIIDVQSVFTLESVEETFDKYLTQIENALVRDREMGGLVFEVSLLSISQLQINPEGDIPVGGQRLIFEIEYESPIPLDSNDFGDFKTAATTWKNENGVLLVTEIETLNS